VVFLALARRLGGSAITGVSKPESLADFWTLYVRAQQQSATRVFHTIGTVSGWRLNRRAQSAGEIQPAIVASASRIKECSRWHWREEWMKK
jgi:hypothetical protein